MKTTEEKEQKLAELMKTYTKEAVCVAFSGGADSSLLLKLAVKYAAPGVRVHGVTFDTVLHPSGDLEVAKQVAKETGAIHKVIFLDEMEDEQIRKNPKNRCYLCKKHLFGKLQDYAREVQAGMILEGTNEEDLHVYRPGLLAVRELGVKSPLAEAGLTKAEVRMLAAREGISVARRPAAPCLATRLPYGAELKTEILRQIEKGEAFLKQEGFSDVRLRFHEPVARIEIPVRDFPGFLEKRETLIQGLKAMGFLYVTLDLEGFRSGSMDEIHLGKKDAMC